MGIDDLVNQGKEFLEQNKDKIGETLKSEQAEGISDNVLDAAADFVKKIAPDSVDAQVDGVRDSIVGRLERHGGSATIRTGPASGLEGTEVVLRMPEPATGE